MKVGVVGVGRVGAACALSLVTRGSAREVVLVDLNRARAKAVATDLRYGCPVCPEVEIRDGDYEDLAGSAVVMITAGLNEKGGGATDRGDATGPAEIPGYQRGRLPLNDPANRRRRPGRGAASRDRSARSAWRTSPANSPATIAF